MKYCPTADMYGDFYTKPTQGGLYKTQRQAIMNLQYNDPDDYKPEGYKTSGSQEFVENNNSNRNEFAAALTGKLKYVCRSRNTLTYGQAVIVVHRRRMSDVCY